MALLALELFALPAKPILFLLAEKDIVFGTIPQRIVSVMIASLIYSLSVFILRKTISNLGKRKDSTFVELGLSIKKRKYLKTETGEKQQIEETQSFPYSFSKKKRRLEITNLGTTTKEDIEKILPELSQYFSQKAKKQITFKNVTEKEFRIPFLIYKRIFVIEEETLPEKTLIPSTMQHHSIYAGVNRKHQDVYINTLKDFSIFVGASTGDGKTVTIKMLLKSFLESVNYDCDIVIFDSKGLDYTDLIDSYNAKFFEMNTEPQLELADEYLKDFIRKFQESKQILKQHNLIHYEDARKQGINIPLKRTFLIMDEAGRYLQPKESASKEVKSLKEQIVNSVTNMLATIRVSGCPIIVSTQRVTKDEMAIPYDNFLVQCFANISKEMDTKYRSSNFFKEQLGLGKWTFKTSAHEAMLIRTAFESTPFPIQAKETITPKVIVDTSTKKPEVFEGDRSEPKNVETTTNESSEAQQNLSKTEDKMLRLIEEQQPKKPKYKDTHKVLVIVDDQTGVIEEKLIKKELAKTFLNENNIKTA
jgi:hypothetical protein